MSDQRIRQAVHYCLDQYLEDLNGESCNAIYRLIIGEAEAATIAHILAYTNYNQTRSAKMLGITRNTLKKKMLEHNISASPSA